MTGNATADAHKRVLVVDDEPGICDLIASALRDHGYEVEQAASGEEALRAVKAHRLDLIMLDVNLPGVDGWEVLAQLRAAAGEQTPVVVMTGGFMAQDQALASGAQGYLGKPFDLDDLYSAVEAHIALPMRGSQEMARTSAAEA
jgi:DNA-binding response OmpR family regulator